MQKKSEKPHLDAAIGVMQDATETVGFLTRVSEKKGELNGAPEGVVKAMYELVDNVRNEGGPLEFLSIYVAAAHAMCAGTATHFTNTLLDKTKARGEPFLVVPVSQRTATMLLRIAKRCRVTPEKLIEEMLELRTLELHESKS